MPFRLAERRRHSVDDKDPNLQVVMNKADTCLTGSVESTATDEVA
jgi:hypothetical protein